MKGATCYMKRQIAAVGKAWRYNGDAGVHLGRGCSKVLQPLLEWTQNVTPS